MASFSLGIRSVRLTIRTTLSAVAYLAPTKVGDIRLGPSHANQNSNSHVEMKPSIGRSLIARSRITDGPVSISKVKVTKARRVERQLWQAVREKVS